MTTLFLHGQNLTSSIKPTYPKDHGHRVLNPNGQPNRGQPADGFQLRWRLTRAELFSTAPQTPPRLWEEEDRTDGEGD